MSTNYQQQLITFYGGDLMNRILFISTLLLASTSFAATPTNTSTTTPQITPAATTASITPAGIPLNQYGAVDVNATVPLALQVPPKPAGFQDPIINAQAVTYADNVPTQPKLNAKSYVLMAANSGAVLAANHANERLAPASLTKLMLLYITEQQLAAGQIHLNDVITVPKVAWATGGSRMFLKPGDKVTVRNLISGIIVESGNDAAVTLATHIAGTQGAMVSLMNQQAKKLGMTNTHFSDVMGLPVTNHYTSAYDMAKLARAIVTQYPQYVSWYGQKWFSYNGIKQPNFNKLLFIYPYAQGLKTGSTDSAGYSLVSTAKMPNRNMRLIGVVLGTPSANDSAADSKALLTYGFHFYKTTQVYSGGETLNQAKTYLGAKTTTPVGVTQAVSVTTPTSLSHSLKASLKLNSKIKAPITKGQTLGTVEITLNGQPIKTTPAVAMTANSEGGFWTKLTDRMSAWF